MKKRFLILVCMLCCFTLSSSVYSQNRRGQRLGRRSERVDDRQDRKDVQDSTVTVDVRENAVETDETASSLYQENSGQRRSMFRGNRAERQALYDENSSERRELAASLDTSGDGVISAQEVAANKALIQALYEENSAERQALALENAGERRALASENSDQRRSLLKKTFDFDGDGKISKEEMDEACTFLDSMAE